MNLFPDETERQRLFPITRSKKFFGHAGVTALPAYVSEAMCGQVRQASETPENFDALLRDLQGVRRACAEFVGAQPEEIALLGPTSLGLSLFANGIAWEPGDEVLCYADDYPANVYPWLELRRRGVVVNFLRPDQAGAITPGLVESALTPATRLVALASCHFLTGYRIDVDAIGRLLHSRGILFSVDAIQTLGAFPFSVEHVDFLSADAHKWMLGPVAMGIVYVKKEHFGLCRPTLLGAWNVYSPDFISQSEVRFVSTAQRYEPGVLNTFGAYGMKAAIDVFLSFGMDRIADRLMELKAHLVAGLRGRGFEIVGPDSGPAASSITTCHHPKLDEAAMFRRLDEAGITCSLRKDRQGKSFLRFSPHFYNTEAELDAAVDLLR